MEIVFAAKQRLGDIGVEARGTGADTVSSGRTFGMRRRGAVGCAREKTTDGREERRRGGGRRGRRIWAQGRGEDALEARTRTKDVGADVRDDDDDDDDDGGSGGDRETTTSERPFSRASGYPSVCDERVGDYPTVQKDGTTANRALDATINSTRLASWDYCQGIACSACVRTDPASTQDKELLTMFERMTKETGGDVAGVSGDSAV